MQDRNMQDLINYNYVNMFKSLHKRKCFFTFILSCINVAYQSLCTNLLYKENLLFLNVYIVRNIEWFIHDICLFIFFC